MSISKLFYFSKNTDAFASIRGYKFQELKTLETWIKNRIDEKDEVIYCDFEEDIFQRDLKKYNCKFRQIKLYSKNFSFSSEEIKKALFHFFMLFSKGEYIYDNAIFIFETNAKIARKYAGNNSDILERWVKNQGNIQDELFEECKSVTKEIIDEYIINIVNEVQEDRRLEFEEYEKYYSSLNDDIWINFINSIRWAFGNKSPEQEVKDLNEAIEKLLINIQTPLGENNEGITFSKLLHIVSEKSIQETPENRGLTNELFDEVIISLGDNDDEWYLINYQTWREVDEIKNFNPGWFFEILRSTQYCRRNNYLQSHSVLWINLLLMLIESDGIYDSFKRRAIYEAIYTKAKPHLYPSVKTPINEFLPHIDFYFETFNNDNALENIQRTKNLLNIIVGTFKVGLLKTNTDNINLYSHKIEEFIDSEIQKEEPNLRLCLLLENKGFLLLSKDSWFNKKVHPEQAIESFEEILKIVTDVPDYSIYNLNSSLEKLLNLLIESGVDSSDIENLENFQEKLIPLMIEREGEISLSKSQIIKGAKYLKQDNPIALFEAINLFHKSKKGYYKEDTIEGYVLCLLNISQLYASSGLNLAAKYYAYASSHLCINHGNEELNKKLADGFSLVLLADLKQGSWFEFLLNIKKYLMALYSFNFQEYEYLKQKNSIRTIHSCAFVLFFMKQISNEYYGFINFNNTEISKFDYDSLISNLVDDYRSKFNASNLDEVLSNNIDGNVINDSGKHRIIRWNALGSNWNISFKNTYLLNSLGEEFCAILQIYQSEIILSKENFHFIETDVIIEIELGDKIIEPKQAFSNDNFKWNVLLVKFDSINPDEINYHHVTVCAAIINILQSLSLLDSTEFMHLIENKLFKKQGINSKTLSVNSYQKIYRAIISQEEFDGQQRINFSGNENYFDSSKNQLLPNFQGISKKYNQKKCLVKIEERYRHCKNAISITLDKMNINPIFQKIVNNYREDGWLDWQILLSLTNKIVSYKTQKIIKRKQNEKEIDFQNRLRKKHIEIIMKSEKDTFMDIPKDYILDNKEGFQMDITIVSVLESFELKLNHYIPMIDSIRHLLNNQFNFAIDDIKEESPFNF